MKRLNIILSLLLITFTACEKEQDMAKVAPADQLMAPVLASHSAIVVTADNLSETTTFKWQRADFGISAAIEYFLYVQVDNGEPTLVSSAYGDSLDVKLEDLNKKIIAAGAEPIVETNTTFILTASIQEDYPTVTSQPVGVRVTTFKPLYPDNMYMIGKNFGDWNWDNSSVVEMTPTWGLEGHFWCIRYITAGNGFKWNTVKSWGGDFVSLGSDVGFTTADGNAFVATSGMYIVYMDMPNTKITIEQARVYGMGDCFGSWDTEQYPFQVNNQTMNLITSAAGELRMYAVSSASPVGGDWWKMEFVILGGNIAYRGAGDDQTRVQVDAGKTVTLDFNAGTGTIQ
ncbi:MAG: SusF/SusE family outer membrane protein [Prevotellaceae bacterium]|jgi:hypothetical protein|nr:SusF/SusE family outer membrane protein [Prevotellaceae bacterium]